MITYPHCTYNSDTNLSVGTDFKVDSVVYNTYDAILSEYNGSTTGTETDLKNELDAVLSTYWAWTVVEWSPLSVNLSENEIIQMTLSIDGTPEVYNFSQTGCVDIPIQSASATVTKEFVSNSTIHDWALLDIWATWIWLLGVISFILIKKMVIWKN